MTRLQVIGAGFGRTGTLSLQAALDQLGFGRTYHGQDAQFRPMHMWLWRKVAHGETIDWNRLFRWYGSAVDYPVCCVWRELAEFYPEARIILTVRDPDAWWKSTATTIYPARDMLPRWMRQLVPTRWYVDFFERLVWDGLFDGRFTDREHALKVFEQHVADVKATADPDRLLVFDVAEGWEPLCAFLGVPVPDGPFPHLNDTARMKRWIAGIRIGSRVLPPLTAAAGVLALLRRRRSPAAT